MEWRVVLRYSDGREVHAVTESRPQEGGTSLWVKVEGVDRWINLLNRDLEGIDCPPLETRRIEPR